MAERVNILGVGVSAINMRDALDTLESWIEEGRQHYICVTPAHSVMDAYADPRVRRVLNQSGMTTPDGMSLVWLLRWMGYEHVERVYGPDLLNAVCARSLTKGYRHFFYGGAPGVADDLASILQEQFPGLEVAGVFSPPFRDLSGEESRQVVEMINRSAADILWVGISSPRQDLWMVENLGKVNAPVLIGIGAAFDFVSGHKKQAPRWVQRSGLEWLFRFANEPRRLWRRYLKYPLFAVLVILQVSGFLRIPIEEPPSQ